MTPRPPSGARLPLGAITRNERLFSNHFLAEVLPQKRVWRDVAGLEARLARLIEIRHACPDAETLNEPQLEDALIRPILQEVLGFTYDPQPAVFVRGGTKKPDHALFVDEAALAEARHHKDDLEAYWKRALAVQESKQMSVELDRAHRGSDLFEDPNPAAQIDGYIRGSGLPWGILTNGRSWRLCHRDTSHRLDTYYEVDLEAILHLEDPEAFRSFLLFFRREAFLPFEGQPSFLSWCLGQSQEIGTAIAGDLRRQAFEALGLLMEGFFRYSRNGLERGRDLTQVHENAIVLLYRILFVLYAEARDFLPRHAEPYRSQYSLAQLLQEIRFSTHPFVDGDARFFERLRVLFRLLDPQDDQDRKDAAAQGIPAYNGGLFSPAKYPFLEQYCAGSACISKALQKLAFAKVEDQTVAIDYYELGTRQLGSIYEGLLEYRPRVATEPLEEKKTHAGIRYVPTADPKKAAYAPGAVYFETDRGERKATGSFYTPDFIVQAIVEATLGPLCAEIEETLETEIAAAKEKASHSRGGNRAAHEQEVARLKGQFDDRVLKLRVLDLSMGSGHFLVAACETLAQRIASHRYTADAKAPDGEAAVSFWKRKVATHCLYGVDLNPLAVELAKLSLWLTTLSRDRPLSFLDARLRVGNSLVGTDPQDLDKAPGGPFAIHLERDKAILLTRWRALSTQPETTLEEVKQKEAWYAEFRNLIARYGDISDLHAHHALRGEPGREEGVLIEHLSDSPALWDSARQPFDSLLETARGAAPFHWELEFPDVLLAERGERGPGRGGRGFDAVIGNPPYVRQERLADLKPYLQKTFKSYHGMADLYVYFYERGLKLLRPGGRLSYVVTNKWMKAGYGEPLRRLFGEEAWVESVVDFGHAKQIFEDADVFPCILVARKPADGPPPETTQVCAIPRETLSVDNLSAQIRKEGYAVPRASLGAAAWQLEPPGVARLLDKIREKGIPLAEYAGVKPMYGIKTGFNEAFLIDTTTRDRLVREDPTCAGIIKPYLRGQDIERWHPDWAGLWMIFTRRGIDIEAYPSVKNHLLPYREQLEPKPVGWSGGTWNGRKPGTYKWYEIQDSVDYWKEFETPKICYQDITWRPQFSLDLNTMYSNNTVYFLPTGSSWILAILNSPLCWWYSWRKAQHCKDEALRFFNTYMLELPIAACLPSAQPEQAAAVSRLMTISETTQETRRALCDWLRIQHDITSPSRALLDPFHLDPDAFAAEVSKARGRKNPLTSAALQDLKREHAASIQPVQALLAQAATLERTLSDLVNQAYALTPEEIALMWHTAPPRMPSGIKNGEIKEHS